jgi:hypothetical protein
MSTSSVCRNRETSHLRARPRTPTIIVDRSLRSLGGYAEQVASLYAGQDLHVDF